MSKYGKEYHGNKYTVTVVESVQSFALEPYRKIKKYCMCKVFLHTYGIFFKCLILTLVSDHLLYE